MFQQVFDKKYFSNYLLLFILIIGIFFRFYNTPARYGFDFDPTRDALVSVYGADHLQFPLTGPKSGIGPFTFGPWYYYQIIVAKLLLPFDYAPWIYIGITSVVVIYVMYKVGEQLNGKKLGLIIGLLTALSPAELGPITGLSNPNLIPIQAALCLYIFIHIVKKQPTIMLSFIWGIVLGIGINNHYQMLGLLVLPVIGFLYKRVSIKIIIFFLIGMFIVFIPLIIFNLKTNFSTVDGIIFYLTKEKNAYYIPNSWSIYIRDFWPGFFSYVIGIPKNFGYFLLAYCLLVTAFLFRNKKVSAIYGLLFIGFLLNFFALRYFSGPRENYYFIYLHPFITIFVGWILWNSLQNILLRYFALAISIGILFFVLQEDIRRLGSESLYLRLYGQANYLIDHFPNKTFQIYQCGSKEKNRFQGIAFLLNTKNKLLDGGIKIGIKSDDCKSKDNTIYLPQADVVIINSVTKHNQDWSVVSPQSVYENTVK